MSLSSLAATALRSIADAVGGKGATGGSNPIGDVESGVDALLLVFSDIKAQKLDLADAETLANAIQQILVDAGIEPAIVKEAITLGEAVLPVIADAYASGIVTGGDLADAARPGGGPGRPGR